MKTEMKTPMSSFSLGSGKVSGAGEVGAKVDIAGSLEMRIAQLEVRPQMPGIGQAVDGEALVLDAGLRPEWGGGAGTLPKGTTQNDMLVWDTVTEKWIKYIGGTSILRWWDTSTTEWKEVEVPSDLGKVLQVNNVAGEGLTFDYLKWR
jgi:hypothetical protein